MSNEKELKEDVIPYLDKRIKRQKGLLRVARKNCDEAKTKRNGRIAEIFEYGLAMLEGIKRDISK